MRVAARVAEALHLRIADPEIAGVFFEYYGHVEPLFPLDADALLSLPSWLYSVDTSRPHKAVRQQAYGLAAQYLIGAYKASLGRRW